MPPSQRTIDDADAAKETQLAEFEQLLAVPPTTFTPLARKERPVMTLTEAKLPLERVDAIQEVENHIASVRQNLFNLMLTTAMPLTGGNLNDTQYRAYMEITRALVAFEKQVTTDPRQPG